MLSVVEIQLGAVLGQLLLNEISQSPEMRDKLWQLSKDYNAAADLGLEDSREQRLLRMSAERAQFLGNAIQQYREGDPDHARLWRAHARLVADKLNPERAERRVQRRQERIEQREKEFYNRMLQRAQRGKKS